MSASVYAGALTPRADKRDSTWLFKVPITDGYFAVYRPSLTDDKIRMGAGSLGQQYELIPKGPAPAWRPWFSAKTIARHHRAHEMWQKEQGKLCYVVPEGGTDAGQMRRMRRLGVNISVRDLKAVKPAEGLWRGSIVLQVRVALRETLGICRDSEGRVVQTGEGGETTKTRKASITEEEVLEPQDVMEMTYELADKLRRELWSERECRDGASAGVPLERRASGEAEKGYRELQFLKGAFGLRFFNLIADDPFAPAKIVGPYDFPHLSVKDGVLEGVWRVTGTFAQEVDLRNFPFDSACWNVVISVIGWSVGVVYDWSSLRSFDETEVFAVRGTSKPFSALHGWPFCILMGTVPNSARQGQQFVFARFYSRRKPRITIINVALPCFLVTLLVEVSVATACGWLNDDPHRVTDGLNICATALLTIVAIKFAYNDSMPVVAYTTLLDTYVNSCLSLITAVTFLIAHVEKSNMPFWNDYGPVIYFLFVIALHGLFAYLGIQAYRLKPAHDQNFKFYQRENFVEEPVEPQFLEPGPPPASVHRKTSILSVSRLPTDGGHQMGFEHEDEMTFVTPEVPNESWSPGHSKREAQAAVGSPQMGSSAPPVHLSFSHVNGVEQHSLQEWNEEENSLLEEDGGISGTSENITEGEGEEDFVRAVMVGSPSRRSPKRALGFGVTS